MSVINVDLFEQKNIAPMLISETQEPFDSADFIYELKFDGERCIAYLDPGDSAVLQGRRLSNFGSRFPELSEIHKAARVKCILDGELVVLQDGRPCFSEVLRRSIMRDNLKIKLAAVKMPACLIVFDILYYRGRQVTDLPLMDRKVLLSQAIQETDRITISKSIEEHGTALFELIEKNGLEGVVAKRKDSRYYIGKRTKDWIKFKNLQDDDFVILGYIKNENNAASIILGQYRDEKIFYQGHVILGTAREDFRAISSMPKSDLPCLVPKEDEGAVWIEPRLVCTVGYMEKSGRGGLRQTIYKGLRGDKAPEECIERQ